MAAEGGCWDLGPWLAGTGESDLQFMRAAVVEELDADRVQTSGETTDAATTDRGVNTVVVNNPFVVDKESTAVIGGSAELPDAVAREIDKAVKDEREVVGAAAMDIDRRRLAGTPVGRLEGREVGQSGPVAFVEPPGETGVWSFDALRRDDRAEGLELE